MTRTPSPPRPTMAPLLAVGAIAATLGVVVGTGLGGGEVPGPAAPGMDPQVRSLLADLTRDVAALRDAVRSLELPPAYREPEPLAVDGEAAPGEVRDGAPLPEEMAQLLLARQDDDVDLADIERRLSAIETLQGQLLILEQSRGALATQLPGVPSGMAVRDYLRALKSGDSDGQVQQAHMLWDATQVRNEYGVPDEVHDRGDYIEWIYWISEDGDQFDFHFVNDLCVQAH